MIALDIDGVVADSYTLLQTIIRYSFGININRQLHDYTIKLQDIPIDIGALFEDCILNFSHGVEPYPDAKEACHLLLENINHPIIFITARRQSLKDLTKKWLVDKLDLHPNSFSVIIRRSAEKQYYIQKSNINCFIEDRFRTVNELACLDCMNKIYLINRRWNIGREADNKVIRKNNLIECVKDYLGIGK